MGALTSSQLYARLIALALGILGGLCQTVWSQVVGMNCGSVEIGEYVFHTECLAWTEWFLRYPPGTAAELVSVVLAGSIAGFIAGAGGMWRPRWAAVLFLALGVANLGLIIGAAMTAEQHGKALGLSVLAVAVPLLCGALLWRYGEYRGRRRPAAAIADRRPWTNR